MRDLVAILPVFLLACAPSVESPSDDSPPQPLVAVCCGGHCVDPSWSSSHETCVTAEGQAVALVPEAGFFELEGGPYESFAGPQYEGMGPGRAPRARVWYAFQPADDTPEEKPLIVLFNGGPGATTSILFGLNTAPLTFDPAHTSGAPYVENPWSWTAFANLLYIDDPGAGLSYHLLDDDGTAPWVGFDPFQDGADFVRVVLRFLARHPQLEAAPVAFVGESYGGMRAAVMLALLHLYASLPTEGAGSLYVDAPLGAEIAAHFARTRPDLGGAPLTSEQVAAQFGRFGAIQGWVSAGLLDPTVPPEGCIDGDYDPYQCDEAVGYMDALLASTYEELLRPNALSAALGVDVTKIEWLHAEERRHALPREAAPGDPDQNELALVFGDLVPGDRWFVSTNEAVSEGASSFLTSVLVDYLALFAMRHTRTMLTAAARDTVVRSNGVFAALAANTTVLLDAELIGEGTSEQAIVLRYHETELFAAMERTIRFPPYPLAGHMVSHREPEALAADIRGLFE
jgi:hypothetical protein